VRANTRVRGVPDGGDDRGGGGGGGRTSWMIARQSTFR